MICKNCGTENAPLKRSCSSCGKILEGRTINNVTGEMGYRHSDGSFTPDEKDAKMFLGKSRIEGISDWNIGEQIESIGTVSFSGKFNHGPLDEEALKLCLPNEPQEIRFIYFEEGFGRYWNNILFRMLFGPPGEKEVSINSKCLFDGVSVHDRHGSCHLEISGKIIEKL